MKRPFLLEKAARKAHPELTPRIRRAAKAIQFSVVLTLSSDSCPRFRGSLWADSERLRSHQKDKKSASLQQQPLLQLCCLSSSQGVSLSDISWAARMTSIEETPTTLQCDSDKASSKGLNCLWLRKARSTLPGKITFASVIGSTLQVHNILTSILAKVSHLSICDTEHLLHCVHVSLHG